LIVLCSVMLCMRPCWRLAVFGDEGRLVHSGGRDLYITGALIRIDSFNAHLRW